MNSTRNVSCSAIAATKGILGSGCTQSLYDIFECNIIILLLMCSSIIAKPEPRKSSSYVLSDIFFLHAYTKIAISTSLARTGKRSSSSLYFKAKSILINLQLLEIAFQFFVSAFLCCYSSCKKGIACRHPIFLKFYFISC